MRRSIIFSQALAVLIGVTVCCGCSPSTWWGIRHITGKEKAEKSEEKTPRAATASPEKRKWWNPFGGKGDKAERQQGETLKPASVGDFEKAKLLVKNERDFAGAKRLLTAVVEANPNHDEAWRWLGDCYYNLLELSPALEAYNRAREINPNNYFALRGKGFVLLYLGHEKWQEYDEALKRKEGEVAQANLSQAHEHYKLALETLQGCMQIYPADDEAAYGRAMAAEGASRFLYSMAVSLRKKEKIPESEAWAKNCLLVIEEGLQAVEMRIRKAPNEMPPAPRALAAGLFLRRAVLLKEFGQSEQAMIDLEKAIAAHRS
ncbi:MAG: tetratricopeptide repeat protein, partial [Planctomycetota bacterium]|nr:tetratricopeptide repeat protein [Planctomycetota bacterium]